MSQNNAEDNPFEDMLADKDSDLTGATGKEEVEEEEAPQEKTEELPLPPNKETKGKSGNKKPQDRGPSTKTLESQILSLTEKVNQLEALIKLSPQSAGNIVPTREAIPQLPETDELLTFAYSLTPAQVKKIPTAKGLIKWLKDHQRPWMLPGALALIKAYMKSKKKQGASE